MKKALLILTSFFAAPAFAGSLDINDPKILGQYELVQSSSDAEIDAIKIIYNNDGDLVLVRDENQEYYLGQADANGVIYDGEDEPNPGSGDEPNCYYDARILIKLAEARNARGQKVPQITIEVDRVDAYEAEPDYSYTVVFNWSAPIEDAVPFFYNMENPAELKSLDDACRVEFGKVTGSEYAHNRVCHSADAFQIRAGVDHQKAFATLIRDWRNTQSLKKSDLQKLVFAPADAYIKNDAKSAGDAATLMAAALPIRQYILNYSTTLAFTPSSGSIAWLFVLDSNNGVMYRFAVFMK